MQTGYKTTGAHEYEKVIIKCECSERHCFYHFDNEPPHMRRLVARAMPVGWCGCTCHY